MHIWKHFSTITRHRHKVIVHCFMAGIFWQGLRHDLSKYSPAEFIPGAKNYLGDKSPNEKERKRKEPVEMPTRYLIEMFCDRVAASKIYYGDDYDTEKPFLYFDKGRKRRWMHPVTSQKLEDLLIMLRDKGEKETFSYIKHVMKPEGKKDKAHWK